MALHVSGTSKLKDGAEIPVLNLRSSNDLPVARNLDIYNFLLLKLKSTI